MSALIVKSRSWRDIEKFYRELDIKPMAELVGQIAGSEYARGIYAATSVSALCISQNSEFEFDRNMLRINFAEDKFIFSYKESPYSGKEWKKECDAKSGFSTFEHVMKRLKWFMS